MISSAIITSLVALYVHSSVANPVPHPFENIIPNCQGPVIKYENKESRQIDGAPIQVSSGCVPHGEENCEVSVESSYSVEATVTVGLSAGIEVGKIGTAGLSAEVSLTTVKGQAETTTHICNGPWACSIVVIPKMMEIKGEKISTEVCIHGEGREDVQPFTVLVPLVKNEHPVKRTELCACPNKAHWADEGAPQKCPQDC